MLPFTHVLKQSTKCSDCGKSRIDKSFLNHPGAEDIEVSTDVPRVRINADHCRYCKSRRFSKIHSESTEQQSGTAHHEKSGDFSYTHVTKLERICENCNAKVYDTIYENRTELAEETAMIQQVAIAAPAAKQPARIKNSRKTAI